MVRQFLNQYFVIYSKIYMLLIMFKILLYIAHFSILIVVYFTAQNLVEVATPFETF